MLKSIILTISFVITLSTSILTYAAIQHVTLEVTGMTCSSCPITGEFKLQVHQLR